MEGLIPFVYKAIVEYKNNNNRQAHAGGNVTSSWLRDSPSASYIRLAGDSGRFSEIQMLMSDYSGINSAASAVQSPVRRRVAT